jgi:type VI secretion system protein
MNERTLLERLMYPDMRPGRSARERKDHLSDSVARHLSRLLNSRQGCCLTQPDYGMPDFNESLGSKNEMRAAFESAIRGTIQKYEPRLRGVVVRLNEDDSPRLEPRFTIQAELSTPEDMPKQVTFATIMDAHGRMSVM